MTPKIFVSATNTNIGKTYAMRLLIEEFSSRGMRVGVFKPIETGVTDEPADAKGLFETAKHYSPALERLTLKDICPYQFTLPAAPYVAKHDSRIEIAVIKKALEKIEKLSDIVLIEGAGGLMVPVQDEILMIDLAAQLSDKVLLVVPSRLGSINDTLLNLHLLKGYGLPFEWTINLFEDQKDFDAVTRPYYEAKFSDYTILQKDLRKVAERLLEK